jgi:ABC-type dipeptide/oligopeptide/nickel transport system permease subunit
VIALLALAVVFLPLLWTADPLRTDLLDRFAGPSPLHPLGTDAFGRDLLARMAYGGRVTLAGAAVVLAAAAGLGLAVGLAAGLAGGWLDRLAGRAIDACLSLPSLVVALAIVGALGRSGAHLVLALVLVSWPHHARLFRALVAREARSEYIVAAIATGCPMPRIALRHVLPVVAGPGVVISATGFGSALLGLASLSFLGLGIQPPEPEWGTMISEASDQLQQHSWPMVVPGVAIAVTVLAVNLLGDALRDVFDPRL